MHADPHIMLYQFALSHGQVRWVLEHLGLRVGDTEAQFDAWLKYVRRMGVPFHRYELGGGAGVNVVYKFHHVMELAVALALRAQGILPLHLLQLLVENRSNLRDMYHAAYHERDSGRGAWIQVHFSDDPQPSHLAGVYLDLHINYLVGGVLTGGNPELLSTREAVKRFMRPGDLMYPRPPVPLSRIATDIVRLADGAPELRRGRH